MLKKIVRIKTFTYDSKGKILIFDLLFFSANIFRRIAQVGRALDFIITSLLGSNPNTPYKSFHVNNKYKLYFKINLYCFFYWISRNCFESKKYFNYFNVY